MGNAVQIISNAPPGLDKKESISPRATLGVNKIVSPPGLFERHCTRWASLIIYLKVSTSWSS